MLFRRSLNYQQQQENQAVLAKWSLLWSRLCNLYNWNARQRKVYSMFKSNLDVWFMALSNSLLWRIAKLLVTSNYRKLWCVTM
jgi:hypothetical protein